MYNLYFKFVLFIYYFKLGQKTDFNLIYLLFFINLIYILE